MRLRAERGRDYLNDIEGDDQLANVEREYFECLKEREGRVKVYACLLHLFFFFSKASVSSTFNAIKSLCHMSSCGKLLLKPSAQLLQITKNHWLIALRIQFFWSSPSISSNLFYLVAAQFLLKLTEFPSTWKSIFNFRENM